MKKQTGKHRIIIYRGSGGRNSGRESSPPSDPCLATKEKGGDSENEIFRVDRVEETRPASGKGKILGKILVMDDQEIIGKAALLMLEYLEYDASFVRDGHEAVKFYIRAKESGQPFDAVILDLTVPGGMSGEEAVQELVELDPQVTAIASSAYFNDPVIMDYKRHGFRGAIVKPYDITELGNLLHTLIGTHVSARGNDCSQVLGKP